MRLGMQCLSSTNEQYLSQKTDLIAELKMKNGNKMKHDRAKLDRNSEVYSDVNRQFTIAMFVDSVRAS